MHLLCKEVNYLKKSKEINYIAQNKERYLLQGHEANTGWPDVEVEVETDDLYSSVKKKRW